jgi:hypothetical protein
MIHERRTEDKTGEKRREKDIEEQGEKGSTFSFIQDPTQSRRETGEKKERKGKRDTKERSSAHSAITAKRVGSENDKSRIQP